jgi:hypothetical protein
MGNYFLTIMDYTREKSTHRVTAADITAANFAAQETLRGAYFAAVATLFAGTVNRSGFGNATIGSNVPPASVDSQREKKWLVQYEGDTSGKIFTLEIPCADLGGDRLSTNSDEANLTDGDWTAYIAAFEAFVKSPDSPAEAVNFLGARFVGRNL